MTMKNVLARPKYPAAPALGSYDPGRLTRIPNQ